MPSWKLSILAPKPVVTGALAMQDSAVEWDYDIVVSGREKLVKPDAAIFRHAAKRFGHAPEAMLFIDDNAANIAGAAAEGWATHHFTDASALEDDLVTRGLVPR